MDLPDAVDVIRPTVVQIGVRIEPGQLPKTLGTGFIVDERATIVTAWHVIEAGARAARAAGVQERPNFTVGLAHPQWFDAGGSLFGMQGFTYVDLDLLSAVPAHDLAAVRMTENVVSGESSLSAGVLIDGVRVPPLVGVVQLDTQRPREGVGVGVSGYPFAMNSLVTNSGSIASAFFPTFADDPIPDPPLPGDDAGTPGELRQQEIMTPGPPPGERYLADLEVNGGNSGGPVYLIETAAVIGVCVATRSAAVTRAGQPIIVNGVPLAYNSGLTVVIPSRYVDAMLRDRLVSG
jgi:hypothetical protein